MLHSPFDIPFGLLVKNIPIRIRRSGDCYSRHFNVTAANVERASARSPDCDAFRKWCVSNNVCLKAAWPQITQERRRYDCSGCLGGTEEQDPAVIPE